jgi:hypothetical protein
LRKIDFGGSAMVCFVPKRLDAKTVLKIVDQLWEDNEKKYSLDISRLIFSLPFGALVLSTELAYRYKQTGNEVELIGYSESNDVHSYLGHVGFFKTARYELGKKPGEAKGSNKYIPLTKLSKEYFLRKQTEMEDEYGITRPLQYFVQKEAEKMAMLIASGSTEVEAIAYCFREIIRNVFEHGETDECVICGQKWDTGVTEIGIVDNGCGILKSLSSKFTVSSDAKALEICLNPGVSSKDTNLKDEWSNSGFGLYILSELGKRFGKFILCSGGSGVECVNGRSQLFDCCFHGTAIRLRLNIKENDDVSSIIDRIANEGELIAAKNGTIIKASKKSRILW